MVCRRSASTILYAWHLGPTDRNSPMRRVICRRRARQSVPMSTERCSVHFAKRSAAYRSGNGKAGARYRLAREPRIEADPSEVERLDKVTVIQEWAGGCLLLAQSGHHDPLVQCPLLGVKRTLGGLVAMSAIDPKRTLPSANLPTSNLPV